MRLYLLKETEKAYLLKSLSFRERWIPKKVCKIDLKSKRPGIYGDSYEMSIEIWALRCTKID
jgi:hypothetical protein